MTFAGHIAVAGLTVQYIHNPVALVAVNLVLHPVLDMVPHAEWTSFPDSKPAAVIVTSIDWLAGAWYIWLLSVHLGWSLNLILGLLAGLWLDIVDPLFGRWLKQLRYMHQWTHSYPMAPTPPVDWSRSVTGRTPLWLKFGIQYGLVAVCYALLVR